MTTYPVPRRDYQPDPRCEFCSGAGCDICLHRLNAAVEWERVQQIRATRAAQRATQQAAEQAAEQAGPEVSQ